MLVGLNRRDEGGLRRLRPRSRVRRSSSSSPRIPATSPTGEPTTTGRSATRSRPTGSSTTYLYRDDPSSPFKPVLTTSYRDRFSPQGFTPDNQQALRRLEPRPRQGRGRARRPGDREGGARRLRARRLRRHERRVLEEAQGADLGELHDLEGGAPLLRRRPASACSPRSRSTCPATSSPSSRRPTTRT